MENVTAVQVFVQTAMKAVTSTPWKDFVSRILSNRLGPNMIFIFYLINFEVLSNFINVLNCK